MCIYTCIYAYTHGLIYTHTSLFSLSWKGLEATTLKGLQVYLAYRPWFLIPIPNEKQPNHFGEMVDSRSKAGNI